MKYVLDSSVAIKWVLPEIDSDKAIEIRDEFVQGLHEFHSPDVFAIEVGHALSRAERAGRVSPADGFSLWLDVMLHAPRLAESLALMPRAYSLSSQMRIGIYDCLYVALAEQEGCEILTADVKLISHFPSVAIPLSSLS